MGVSRATQYAIGLRDWFLGAVMSFWLQEGEEVPSKAWGPARSFESGWFFDFCFWRTLVLDVASLLLQMSRASG